MLSIAFVGCATFGTPENPLTPEPVEFSADYEVLELRIPVFRPYTDSSVVGQTSESQASDHPLTVNIGNGLAIDANGVLFLRVDELLEMDRYQDYTVRTTYDGRRRVRRRDDQVRIGRWTWNPFMWRTTIQYEDRNARVGGSVAFFLVGPTDDGFAWAPRDLSQTEVIVGPYGESSYQVGNTVVTYDPETSHITFSDARGAISDFLTRERTVMDRIEFRDDHIRVYANEGVLGAVGLRSSVAARVYRTDYGYEIFGDTRMRITVAENEVSIESGFLPAWLGGRDRFRLQQD